MAEPRLEQTKQTGVVSAFADMARQNKSLMAAISLDQAKYLLAQILGVARPGAPIDAAPLYDYLRETGAPPEAIHELFLGLERRVGNLGLQLQLPPATAALPASERTRLAEKGMGRANDAKRGPTLGESGVRSAAAGRAAAEAAPSTLAGAAAAAASASPAPAAPVEKRPANKLLLAGAGLAALVAAVYFLAPLFAKDPKADAMALLGPPGEPTRYVCASVEVIGGMVVCKVDVDLAKGLAPDHKSKLESTRARAKSAGYKNVRLFEQTSGRPLPEPR